MKAKFFIVFAAAFVLVSPGFSMAHTPLFSCFDNADGTIYCEGGFSDGSTAAGIPIIVMDGSGEAIATLQLTRNSDIEFDKPEGDYSVLFDGGEGHEVLIPGSQIFQ